MTPLEYNTQSATQEVNSQGNVNMYVVLKVQNLYSSLAQSVEHAAVNRSVVGSSPTGGVFFVSCKCNSLWDFFMLDL